MLKKIDEQKITQPIIEATRKELLIKSKRGGKYKSKPGNR